MKSTFSRFVCRVLDASMMVLPWQAQAEMIGTGQALSAAQQNAARGTAAGFINRGEVAGQLQLLGLSPQAASERVAALSDAEVAGLAGRLDALPAGGIAGVLPVVVGILLIYFLLYVPATTTTPATGKPKPAPAPEQK